MAGISVITASGRLIVDDYVDNIQYLLLTKNGSRLRMSSHSAFDLVIGNAQAVTASDTFQCDIGVREGRIVQLGLALDSGAREIDAAGRPVTPGGVDAHCHLDQP